MKLPGFLLRHRVTWQRHQGATGLGEAVSGPVTRRCWLEHGTKTVTDSAGVEKVSTARIFLPLEPPVPAPEDRVTVDDGTTGVVISVDRRDGAGLPVPSHYEVAVG